MDEAKTIGEALSAWEEINPPMASAPQPERRLPCSAPLAAAPSDQFRDELTACLALVVPSGMDESARREWLLVAWKTLSHLPTDLLKRGCAHARRTADHPSKIVPAILREVQDDLDRRWERRTEPAAPMIGGGPRMRSVCALRDRRGGPGPMTEAELAALNAYLEWAGATVRYRRDGSKYPIERAA